jgi:lysophospholipase L1-like esterase
MPTLPLQYTIAHGRWQDIVWTGATGCTVSGNDLLNKSGANSWTNAGAHSTLTGIGCRVTCTVAAGNRSVVGLNSVNTETPSLNGIDFGLYVNESGERRVYENGSLKDSAGTGTVSTNDTVSVQIVAGSPDTVQYFQNGVSFYTSASTPSGTYYVDTSLYLVGADVYNGELLLPATASTWLDRGLQYAIGSSAGGDEPMSWLPETLTDIVDVTLSGLHLNTVRKNAIGGAWNAGAFGTTPIPGDGGVRMVVTEQTSDRMLGLSYVNNGVSYTTIDYAFDVQHHTTSNQVGVFESGTGRGNKTTYVVGDVLSIERVGTTVYYKKNGTTYFTSTVSSTGTLYADTSFSQDGALISNIEVEAAPPPPLPLTSSYVMLAEVFSDTFDRADSATVGNSWTEETAAAWSIASNKLHGLRTTGDYQSLQIKRPPEEAFIDGVISVDFIWPGSPTNCFPQVHGRAQGTSDNSVYLAYCATSTQTFYLSKSIAGTYTDLATQAGLSLATGVNYRITLTLNGSSISGKLVNLDTGAVLANLTRLDGALSGPGVAALSIGSTSTVNAVDFNNFTVSQVATPPPPRRTLPSTYRLTIDQLTMLERFDGDLAYWNPDAAGGTVAIQDTDNDAKLILTASTGNVSATRAFVEPDGAYIVAADLYAASSVVGALELLDAADTMLASVAVNGTTGNADFQTDTVGASTFTFTAAYYRMVVLLVDPDAGTVSAWRTDSPGPGGDGLKGSYWAPIATKAYTGTAGAKVRFRTTSGTGEFRADEVKVFRPDLFALGDSLTAGSGASGSDPGWNPNPAEATRLGVNEDETHNYADKLGNLFPARRWVACRGVPGDTTTEVLARAQGDTVDQGARRVFLLAGTNDVGASVSASTIESNLQGIIDAIVGAGAVVLIGTIPPVGSWSGAQNTIKSTVNTWIRALDDGLTVKVIETHDALADPVTPTQLLPAYAHSDGVHLTAAGLQVVADLIYAGLYFPSKFATYAVVTTHGPGGDPNLAKVARYAIAASTAVQAAAQYTVTATPAALSKAETYRVALAHPLAEPLLYVVGTGSLMQEPSRYAVTTSPAVGLPSAYSLAGGGGPTSVTIQRGCSYAVETNTATYYVDKDGLGGSPSDANPGTESQPWATLAHALATAESGALIYVRAGEYHENGLDFAHGGSYSAGALKYTRVVGYPGESVVLDGDFTGTEAGTQQVFFTRTNKSYISVEDLEIRHSLYQAWYTDNSSPASRLRARNLHIHDIYGWVGDNAATIRWDNITDGLIDGCTLHDVWNQDERPGHSHPLSGYANGVMTYNNIRFEIRNTEVYNAYNLVFQKNADSGGGSGMRVHHCVLHDSSSGGVALRYGLQGTGSPPHHDQVAHHNVFYNNPGGSVYGELDYASDISDGITFYNNTVVSPRPYTMKGGFLNQQVYNNIFVCTGGSGDFRFQLTDGAGGTAFYPGSTNTISYMDHNLYDSTYTARNWNLQVGLGSAYSTSSFTAWKALTSSQPDLSISNPDANGLSADPLFTNPGAYDFTLQAGSPAIGAGRFGGDIGATPFAGNLTRIGAPAAYRVRSTPEPTAKGAAYRVATTPVPAALGLAYEVVAPPGLRVRAAGYKVRATKPETAAVLRYGVRTPAAPVGRFLAYEIDTAVHVPVMRGLAYLVTASPARAMGLAYALGGATEETVRTVAVPPETHGGGVPPETHTVQVTG